MMQVPDDDALGPRDTVTVSGPDAMTYLQSQLSQDITALGVGDAAWTFVLDPAGKIVVLARVRRRDDSVYALDTDAGFGEVLEERLNRFRIRVEADLERSDDESGVERSTVGERRRIEMGWPRMGAELVPGESMVAGTGLAEVAVSFTKGCYPGQELVERMDSRAAQAPRSLRVISVDDGASPGDPVVAADGSEIGTITSVADGVALAWIQRGAEPNGSSG